MNNNNNQFEYDNIGNRTYCEFPVQEEYYESNALNAYTKVWTYTPWYARAKFYYDLDGNMITNQLWAYTWNAENRMSSATNTDDGTFVTYAYDYQGRMFEKVTNGVTNNFVWNGNYIISEVTDTATNLYTWSNGETLCANLNGETVFYVHDANKNVTDLVDDSGSHLVHYDYSPFGEESSTVYTSPFTVSLNPFRFSNEYWDSTTSLVEYKYRKFYPSLAKFLSLDPIGVQGGLNEYGICGNDLVNHWDELGLYRPKFGWTWPLDKRAYVINILTAVEVRLYSIIPEMDVLIKEAKALPNKCPHKKEWLRRLAETRAIFKSTLSLMKSDIPLKVYRNSSYATMFSPLDKDEEYALVPKRFDKLVVNDHPGGKAYFFDEKNDPTGTVLHEITHKATPGSVDSEYTGWKDAALLEQAMEFSMRYTLSKEWSKLSLPDIVPLTEDYDDCCDGYTLVESKK
ncbi:MAG: RHS repeat-associated core domain-containing protein [Kiritimatiellae bacterium]|jgi:RHS repeat-associated protein|nr:RHS repeat-associated core domain-containing protein [Kiritimatiellia bacterium]